MTTFLLIRHALADPVGHSIAGRTPGIRLNQEGRAQAEALADRLAKLRIAAVYSSPLERALETAQPIATRQGLTVTTLDGLNEIDFGSWTGRTLKELDSVPEWKGFNQFRTGARIPGGETIGEVLARAWGALLRLQEQDQTQDQVLVVVSHADVLRAVLAYALGMSLDHMLRLELGPGSVSVLELQRHGSRVSMLNGLGEWPADYPLPARK